MAASARQTAWLCSGNLQPKVDPPLELAQHPLINEEHVLSTRRIMLCELLDAEPSPAHCDTGKCLPSLSSDECRRARGNSTCAELIQVHLILDVSHELAQRWAALLQRVLEPTCKRGVLSRARLALLSQRPPGGRVQMESGA